MMHGGHLCKFILDHLNKHHTTPPFLTQSWSLSHWWQSGYQGPPIWNVDRLYGQQCDSMFMWMNLCSAEHVHQSSVHMQKEKKVPLGCISEGQVGLGQQKEETHGWQCRWTWGWLWHQWYLKSVKHWSCWWTGLTPGIGIGVSTQRVRSTKCKCTHSIWQAVLKLTHIVTTEHIFWYASFCGADSHCWWCPDNQTRCRDAG